MSAFRRVSPGDMTGNIFKQIGEDWLLITSEQEGKANTMTASWGGVGIYAGKPVATYYIRPQRYTKEFVDASGACTLSFFGGGYREQLTLCGSNSGRDMEKFAACGFSVEHAGGVPYIAQAQTVLVCRNLFAQPMAEECFLDGGLVEHIYPGKDFHTLYIAEITEVLVKE